MNTYVCNNLICNHFLTVKIQHPSNLNYSNLKKKKKKDFPKMRLKFRYGMIIYLCYG